MPTSPLLTLLLVVLGVPTTYGQMEMKRVVGNNATLPCHHQFLVGDDPTLDIEWLLLKPTNRQRVVITYFAGRVFDPDEAEHGRVAFAGDYLKGDASLLISDLSLTDSGEYSCKVKTGVQYHWSTISLIVLVKPSKPQCWLEGKLLEGGDVKMSCKSADGSDPIHYKWERVLDKVKYVGKLPPLAMIDLKNPEIVTLRNLTKDSTGVYKCTASNDVGEESCTVEVKMHWQIKTLILLLSPFRLPFLQLLPSQLPFLQQLLFPFRHLVLPSTFLSSCLSSPSCCWCWPITPAVAEYEVGDKSVKEAEDVLEAKERLLKLKIEYYSLQIEKRKKNLTQNKL